MDNLGLLSIGLKITSYAIAEAHADGNKHIALLLFQIHGVVTVHAQHTYVQRMI